MPATERTVQPAVQPHEHPTRREALGVETLAIVNTPLDRARLYFRNDARGIRIGVDPERRVHEAWAVPKVEVVAPVARTAPWPIQSTFDEFLSARINPTGEMPAPVNPLESNDVAQHARQVRDDAGGPADS